MKNKAKIKIAVLVSGGGTNLQALIDAEREGAIKNGERALVVSNNREAYALVRAQEAEIKKEIISKKELGGSQELFEEKLVSVLEENGIELIVLAGFMSILSESFTKRYEKRIINIHPSLIPAFCGKGYYGLKVHEEALKRGVKVTGATVHYVNEIPDGGEIITQKSISIRKGETPESLQKRVMKNVEWKILPRATEDVCKELLSKKNG